MLHYINPNFLFAGFKVSLIVDKKYKRTKETLLDVYSMNAHTCVNATITLSVNIYALILTKFNPDKKMFHIRKYIYI